MYFMRKATLLSLALVLGGCAAPMRLSLTPEQRGAIGELDARVVVVQDEVIVAVQASNVSGALGGGLIGALIDSSITNKRVKESQDVMGQLYQAIENVDYRKEFNEAVQQGLGEYPIKVAKFTTTPRALSSEGIQQARDSLQRGQALLLLYPRYTLTSDFRSLDSEAIVTIWTKDAPNNGLVQRGVLHYQSAPVGTGGQDSVAHWSGQDAAAFRAAMRESISETMGLLRRDLDVTEQALKNVPSKEYRYNTGADLATIKGRLVSETGTRVTVLGDDQKLYSLPKMAGDATVAAQ